MPSISSNLIRSIARTEEIPSVAGQAQAAVAHFEDQFERAAGLRGPETNNDAYFVANVQNQLQRNGIVGVSDGRYRVLCAEHLEKVRHLIGKSDEPRFFVVHIDEVGEILGINSYLKKGEWMKDIERRNLGLTPDSIRDLKLLDKTTQLECLARILGPDETEL